MTSSVIVHINYWECRHKKGIADSTNEYIRSIYQYWEDWRNLLPIWFWIWWWPSKMIGKIVCQHRSWSAGRNSSNMPSGGVGPSQSSNMSPYWRIIAFYNSYQFWMHPSNNMGIHCNDLGLRVCRLGVTTVTFCNPHQRIPESSASFLSPQAHSRNLTLIPDSEHPFLIMLDHSWPDRAQPDCLYLSLISSSSLSLASSHTLPLPLSRSLHLTLWVLHLCQPYTT